MHEREDFNFVSRGTTGFLSPILSFELLYIHTVIEIRACMILLDMLRILARYGAKINENHTPPAHLPQ